MHYHSKLFPEGSATKEAQVDAPKKPCRPIQILLSVPWKSLPLHLKTTGISSCKKEYNNSRPSYKR